MRIQECVLILNFTSSKITFLGTKLHPYVSLYCHSDVVSTWSSGTGAAGVAGALSYAGLTAIGVTPRTTLLVMISVPVIMLFRYSNFSVV